MTVTRIALLIARNEGRRQALEFSRPSANDFRRRNHLRRQADLLEYALSMVIHQPKETTLRAAMFVLSHCAEIDHTIPEIIDAISVNDGVRNGLHTRHSTFRNNAENAIGKYADFLVEVQNALDEINDATAEGDAAELIAAVLG